MTRWIGDQNNPNRDLSDPNWISVEGSHTLQREKMNNFKKKVLENKDYKILFRITKDLGFEYECVEHRYLCNDDDFMKKHLLEEHDINLPFKHWESCFTTFTVGDSYSNDWRCRFCGGEFMLEKEAKNHIKTHSVRLESEEKQRKEPHKNIKVWYSDNGENGILFSVLKFDPDLPCEECSIMGSYWMINEKYKIGACTDCGNIDGNIGEGKLWKKKEYTDSDSLEGINP